MGAIRTDLSGGKTSSSSPEIRLSAPAEWLCLYLFHASLCACWLTRCTALSQRFHPSRRFCVSSEDPVTQCLYTVKSGPNRNGFIFSFFPLRCLCWCWLFETFASLSAEENPLNVQNDVRSHSDSFRMFTFKICFN